MTLPVPVVAPAVANNVNTYASRSSYVTVQEFKDAPTAVELDNLVLNGSTASQDEALAVVIERASSWADALTYQTLAATVDTAYGRARVRSDGTVRFPLPFKPVIAVLGIAVGGRPSAMSPMGSLSTWSSTSTAQSSSRRSGWRRTGTGTGPAGSGSPPSRWCRSPT
jgi:hypothetical protein